MHLLTYLTLVYAFLSFGMGVTSFIVWRSRKIYLMKIVAVHWLIHFCNFFTSTYSGIGGPDAVNQVLVCMIMWPCFGLIQLKITKVISPSMNSRNEYFWLVPIGYGMTFLLSFTNASFTLKAIPGTFALIAWCFINLWRFCASFNNREMNILIKSYVVLLCVMYLHILDWPFLRMSDEAAIWGSTLFLFMMIGFASILPAIAFDLSGEARRVELEGLVAERTEQMLHQFKFSALGEMAAGVAHEINNPLAILSGRLDQMERKLKRKSMNVEFEHQVLSMHQMVIRITKIVRALKDFSAQDSMEPFRPVSIRNIIEEIQPLCWERFSNNGVILQIEGNQDLIVEGRSLQLSQVFLNLLNNAFDAIQALDEKWIRISIQESEDKVKIEVTDSGHGVSEELREKIMQPFFTTKELGKGTGLGLSISNGIIKNHGGALTLAPHQDHTQFVIELPSRLIQ